MESKWEEVKDVSAISILAVDYKEDLEILRLLLPVIVTDVDINKLKILSAKYGLKVKVDRESFIDVLGELNNVIRGKLEELAIVHVLESEKADTPFRKPKERVKSDMIPDVLLKRRANEQ